MKKYLFYLMVVIAGGMSTIQGPVNAQLKIHFAQNVFLATFISYFSSFIIMVLLALLLRVPGPNWKFGETKWWYWFGGIVGGSYVCIMALAATKISVTSAISVVVFGQIFFGLLLDQFGFLELQVRKISSQRFAGVVLVLIGAALVFNF